MTVLITFFCSDGIVIGADSMITPSIGGISVGHHHGQKISVLQGSQVYAFAGDQGQSERVRIMADGSHALASNSAHPIDYPIALSQSIIAQFTSTGIGNSINISPILAFPHLSGLQCCVFEGAFQPRLLDSQHFYSAAGSGKLSADPFLRFITDIFCNGRQPSVAEAVFLTTWTIRHVIDVNPGGVADPIRIATLTNNGGVEARLMPEAEIDEHLQAVESAAQSLRDWRDGLGAGQNDIEVPQQPSAPDA